MAAQIIRGDAKVLNCVRIIFCYRIQPLKYIVSNFCWPLACVAGAWKQWAQEKTGARGGDTRHAPSPLACLPRARPFSLSPATSKRLLRRLAGHKLTDLSQSLLKILKFFLHFKLRELADGLRRESFLFFANLNNMLIIAFLRMNFFCSLRYFR